MNCLKKKMIKLIFVFMFLFCFFVSYKSTMINKCKFSKVVSESKSFSMLSNGEIIKKEKIGKLIKNCGSL